MRRNYISWDEYFLSAARVVGSRSKDPNCQNGAVIVHENRIIGTGYNGFIKNIEDTDENWTKENKYKYVYHAERNAIANTTKLIEGSQIYIWSSKNYIPCQECARSIIQHGINVVHVLGQLRQEDLDHPLFKWNETKELFKMSGVDLIQHDITVDDLFKKILNG